MLCCFFDQALKSTAGNNFKKFSLRMLMIKHQQVHGTKFLAQNWQYN